MRVSTLISLRHTRRRRHRDGARGVALVTTVWMSLFIALTAATIMTAVRTESSQRRNAAELAAARELAKAGLHLAIHEISLPNAERSMPRDGRATALDFEGGTLIIGIEDERGKLDLRQSPPTHVQALLRRLGSRSGIDAFDAVTLAKRLAGAVDANRSGDARTAEIHSMGALASIQGMSPALHAELPRHATIFGFDSQVNPMTASREVLMSIPGIDPNTAGAIIAAREAGLQRSSAGAAEVSFTNLEGPVYTVRATGRTANGIEASLTAVVGSAGIGIASRAASVSILELR